MEQAVAPIEEREDEDEDRDHVQSWEEKSLKSGASGAVANLESVNTLLEHRVCTDTPISFASCSAPVHCRYAV